MDNVKKKIEKKKRKKKGEGGKKNNKHRENVFKRERAIVFLFGFLFIFNGSCSVCSLFILWIH